MKKQMLEKGIDFTKPIIACSVTAKYMHKVYPLNSMVKALKLILEKNQDITTYMFWN